MRYPINDGVLLVDVLVVLDVLIVPGVPVVPDVLGVLVSLVPGGVSTAEHEDKVGKRPAGPKCA